MERAEERVGPAKARVLLYTQDPFKRRLYVAALEKATVSVECVATASALRSRLDRADLPRPTLVMVLPSRGTSLRPGEVARLAVQLTADPTGVFGPPRTISALAEPLNEYCAARSLSARQRQVLERYLIGNNDKEIASVFNCSATTVYEHWRRMARKAKGAHKSDVVNDFHRFLAARSDGVSVSSLDVPGRPVRPSGP
jgi:DNA-binding CsgD family transcriptional regulator